MAAAAAAASSTTSSWLFAAVLLCAAAFSAAHAAETDEAATGGDLVAKTCANAMTHDWAPWLDRKTCESTLRLDKRSAAAKHPRDLALVAVDLARRAVADADSKVEGVLRSGAAGRRGNDTAAVALVLQSVRLEYAAVASAIPVCRAMVEGYKPGGASRDPQLAPSEYFECARRLRRGTHKCWARVIFDKDLSELLREVEVAWERSHLVEAMLEEMLGIVNDDHDPNF